MEDEALLAGFELRQPGGANEWGRTHNQHNYDYRDNDNYRDDYFNGDDNDYRDNHDNGIHNYNY